MGTSGLFSYDHNFNGFGGTAALQAFRQLGGTRLRVFGTVRGSLLAGVNHETTYSTGALAGAAAGHVLGLA